MPRTRFSTPSKWATPFVALIIAIVVHVLFFSFFYHKNPKIDNINSTSNPSGVSMLNISELDQNKQQDFYNYLKIHDSKNYFDSNNPSNYSSYLPKEKIIRKVNYSIPRITIDRQLPEIKSYTKKNVVTIPHAHYTYLNPKSSIYGIYPATESFVNSKRNVLVLNSFGKAINNLTLPLPKNILVSKPTIIKISSKFGVERLTLFQKSDNPELDQIALKAVRHFVHNKENQSYTFYWPLTKNSPTRESKK